MPSFFKSAAALAMAGAAAANPMLKRDDSCLAAVTGNAALGDAKLRKEHCTSFFKTIVTPAAKTVTTTITDAPAPSTWNGWEKRDVTVCPNEVPNYASACHDEKAYASACNAWGVTGVETTFTIPATTWTKTVYAGQGGVCATGTVTSVVAGSTVTVAGSTVTVGASTETKTVTLGHNGDTTYSGDNTRTGSRTGDFTDRATTTVTVTTGGSFTGTRTGDHTTTVTVTGTGSFTGTNTPTGASPSGTGAFPYGPGCLTQDKADELVGAFKDLLTFTDMGTINGTNAPYHKDISAKYLTENFTDYSDSINWMAHLPLGIPIFTSRAAFDIGQGQTQFPLVFGSDEFIHFGCKHITWRWTATTFTYATVRGINHFLVTDDLTQLSVNYAEYNSAAWIQSLNNIPGVSGINCNTPQQAASNTTGTTRKMFL